MSTRPTAPSYLVPFDHLPHHRVRIHKPGTPAHGVVGRVTLVMLDDKDTLLYQIRYHPPANPPGEYQYQTFKGSELEGVD